MQKEVFQQLGLVLATKKGKGYGLLLILGIVANLLGLFISNQLLPIAALLFMAVIGGTLFYEAAASKRETMIRARLEREFNSIVDHVHEGVVIYRPDSVVIGMNQAAERIFKIESREVLGKRMDPGLVKDAHLSAFIQTLFPSLAPRVVQLSDAGAWPQITTITLQNPSRELNTSLHPIADARGGSIAFLKLIKDLSEEEMMAASEKEFVSVAAHQLRTPLTAISWSLESLTKLVKDGGKEVTDLVSETRNLVERTLKTTNDLLDVTKIEQGKLEYHPVDTDLVVTMEKILQVVAPIAKAHEVSVFLNPPEAALPLLNLDENRISAAVINFLDNAIRYNIRGGKVMVSFELKAAPPAVKVSITDTGVGIPQEDLGKLFGKLQRGSNIAQVEPNGSGLGLYIAKNIIVHHGGEVGIDSELNRGTTVWFTLPLRKE